ncbi:glutaredoxin family protein [Thermoleophilia bacterium SCSIO 60948]|nr:glutaredoxin family protein [Thermoleophilia bacterium SCSIO 60948]
MELELLGREGCHLCEQARAALAEVAADPGVELRWSETDIDSDDALLRRYLERIPVVRRDGRELCELVVEADDVRGAIGLAKPGSGGASGGY